ncbi:unnamed protein product [Periconia digitata]|uniref:Alpha/beta-hydrolase n=1 Tax=Periconia digitata TaxID=1303443 RepID=A0A9W4UEN7_9PLEO|nr:unnamed protein product [Periconia digitata]
MYKDLLIFTLFTLASADGFADIQPSTNLTWTPCFDSFDSFGCAKLKVPLDYSNESLGTTSIAFLKLTGKNATVNSPSIILIPGGPGGSGVDLLTSSASFAEQAFGPQYNIISYDPRGVNNSGLTLDCFPGNLEARTTFSRLHTTGVTNVSTNSLQEQFFSSTIYGDWSNSAVKTHSPYGYYVTTPAVANDLRTFIEAEATMLGQPPSEAKLWAYAISYGTVVGSTFASMFPDRVEKMVLDGVLNAEEYYNNDWRQNVDQMDDGMAEFSKLCHSAGPEKCSFWGPTPANITCRIDQILDSLKHQPVAISGVPSGTPAMVTHSDLKALFLDSLYLPISKFPAMADILHQVESGNVTSLVGMFSNLNTTVDARLAIMCTDSSRTNKLTSIDEFKDFVEYTTSKSKYLGDLWPIFQDPVLCRSLQPELPDSMLVQAPISAQEKPTSFPILFTSNTIDPITPLISARTMSSRFAGSVLLQQEGIGHTVINQGGSICYFGHVQMYFQGVVPSANTTCSMELTPFVNDPVVP